MREKRVFDVRKNEWNRKINMLGEGRTMIELSGINKTYKTAKRGAGFGAAVKALFHKEYTYLHALDDVSFTIGDGEMVGYIGPKAT